MTGSRLQLAFPDGHPGGEVLVFGAGGNDDLSPLDPERTAIRQGMFPDCRSLTDRGYRAEPEITGQFATAIVFLPRSKLAARADIAAATGLLEPGGTLWVNGQKTDGIDAILKEIRGLHAVDEVHSKAHGKIFRVKPAGDWLPAEWESRSTIVAPGFVTRPGVFSADGIDPGSALLARCLPERLPTRLVDLGAAWGWLAAQALGHPGVELVHLVEASHPALESARENISDARARFHWADARDFRLPEPVNGVIMNPPFHEGRAASTGLGAEFIAAAAGMLTGAGRLWMVANRHLPYETVLHAHFAKVAEIGGDNRYKVFEASGSGRGGNRQRGRK